MRIEFSYKAATANGQVKKFKKERTQSGMTTLMTVEFDLAVAGAPDFADALMEDIFGINFPDLKFGFATKPWTLGVAGVDFVDGDKLLVSGEVHAARA